MAKITLASQTSQYLKLVDVLEDAEGEFEGFYFPVADDFELDGVARGVFAQESR